MQSRPQYFPSGTPVTSFAHHLQSLPVLEAPHRSQNRKRRTLTAATVRPFPDRPPDRISLARRPESDPQGLSIEYRTKDGRKVMRPVTDKRLLEGLHVGDRIEVTLTRERAVSVERVRR
jgi:hypothetical protein